MPSPIYRGDNPGFQTQAIGNYPAKSDCADKDNIYLSDRGWVYRHFKNKAKTRYWDEIIWAGDVTDPPTENDPVALWVGNVPAANPTFEQGDGFQFVQGPYPGINPAVGTVIISGPKSMNTGVADTYAITVSGLAALTTDSTFAWSATGPGTVVFGTATGTFGSTPANADANTTVQFPAAGAYTLSCVVKQKPGDSTGSLGTYHVDAEVAKADTLGTVSVNGETAPTLATAIPYTIGHTGSAQVGEITYALAVTSAGSGVGTVVQDSINPDKFTVSFDIKDTYTLTATLTDSNSSPTSATGTATVDAAYEIGTVTAAVAGGVTSLANDTASGNITLSTTAEGGIPTGSTFQWSASPSSSVTFTGATTNTATFKASTAGDYDVTCAVTNANAVTSPVTSTTVTFTVAA